MSSLVKFLIFSDIHFHEFSYGAKLEEFYDAMVNSRLLDCHEAMMQVYDYARENSIDSVFFLGDLFHSKRIVTKDVVSVISDALSPFSSNSSIPTELFVIPGNHDFSDKECKNHGLNCFDSYMCLHATPSFLFCHGVPIVLVPYTPDKKVLIDTIQEKVGLLAEIPYADYKRTKPILMAHTGIQGARVGGDFVLINEHDLSVSDLNPDDFLGCFFGHYHEHQKVFKNGWIVGAPLQHGWGDVGGTRGFLEVTVDTDTQAISVKHIPTVGLPKFHVVRNVDDMKDVTGEDFVRFVGNLSPEEKDNVLAFTHANFAAPPVVEFVPEREEPVDLDFSSSADILDSEKLLSDWIDSHNTTLDKEKLLQAGRDLLQKVRQV